ncbi:hypothetical protein AAZX31_19G068300 [Glycine max]
MFVFALFLIVTTFLCYLAAPSLILPLAFPFKVYRSCCCGRIMARAPDNIKSINGSKEALKLARRITDLWFVGTPNRSEQAEMVIIDSHVWFSLFLMYGFLCLFFGSLLSIQPITYILCLLQGDTIHVVCKQDQLKSWKADLIENCTYVMHNFKVMKNDGQFRICDQQYKLVFTGVIVLGQSNLEDLPFKNINLLISPISLLGSSNLNCWLVSLVTIF